MQRRTILGAAAGYAAALLLGDDAFAKVLGWKVRRVRVLTHVPDTALPAVARAVDRINGLPRGPRLSVENLGAEECPNHRRGHVVLCQAEERDGTLGVTGIQKQGGYIVSAKVLIRVPPDNENYEYTVVHELGHAMGLGHNPSPDSLMYPWDTGATAFNAKDRKAWRKMYGGKR